ARHNRERKGSFLADCRWEPVAGRESALVYLDSLFQRRACCSIRLIRSEIAIAAHRLPRFRAKWMSPDPGRVLSTAVLDRRYKNRNASPPSHRSLGRALATSIARRGPWGAPASGLNGFDAGAYFANSRARKWETFSIARVLWP